MDAPKGIMVSRDVETDCVRISLVGASIMSQAEWRSVVAGLVKEDVRAARASAFKRGDAA